MFHLVQEKISHKNTYQSACFLKEDYTENTQAFVQDAGCLSEYHQVLSLEALTTIYSPS